MARMHLTKSGYIAGLQCLRRLWLLTHEQQNYHEPAPGSPTDVGLEIGLMARVLFPGGALVDEDHARPAETLARTNALMSDPGVTAIFEAAVAHDDVLVRVDVLVRHPIGWGLLEVKSSSRVKDHHLDDVAIQVHTLGGAGVPLRSVEVALVNTGYVRGPGEIDWTAFFTRVDVSGAVATRLADIPARLVAMRLALDLETLPDVEPGKQCSDPHECQFWDRCTKDKPADWIFFMPGITAAQRRQLDTLGVAAISDIPAAVQLNAKQQIIRDAVATGRPYVAPDLGRLLHRFGPPACYLDFEAMVAAVPLYEGTRPYQAVPFQWSMHVRGLDGALHHMEFLAPAKGDPRRAFAETLIAALSGSEAPIIVYSAYEQTQLRALATQFPDLKPALDTIIGRLADLLPIVRGAVYFPAFDFSNSIKKVGPALSPELRYDDLDGIADGNAASVAFMRMASGALTDEAEVRQLRAALLKYCKRDTLAMVHVHEALARLARGHTDGPVPLQG